MVEKSYRGPTYVFFTTGINTNYRVIAINGYSLPYDDIQVESPAHTYIHSSPLFSPYLPSKGLSGPGSRGVFI